MVPILNRGNFDSDANKIRLSRPSNQPQVPADLLRDKTAGTNSLSEFSSPPPSSWRCGSSMGRGNILSEPLLPRDLSILHDNMATDNRHHGNTLNLIPIPRCKFRPRHDFTV